jgi:hypothetical protein
MKMNQSALALLLFVLFAIGMTIIPMIVAVKGGH